MELQTITNILIALVGATLGLLVFVAKYSMGRLITQIDYTSQCVNRLTQVVDKLNITIEGIQIESATRYGELQKRLDEHHVEIEMLRDSRHKMIGYITNMRLQGQLKNGWDFKSEWELPGVFPIEKE